MTRPGAASTSAVDGLGRLDRPRRVVRAAHEHDVGLLALDQRDGVVRIDPELVAAAAPTIISVPVMRAMCECSA